MPRSRTARAALLLCLVLFAISCAAAAARSSTGLPAMGAVATGAVLYRDDFKAGDAGAPPGWEVESGRWQGVVADPSGAPALAHSDGPGTAGTLVAGSASWIDYVVEADVKPAAGPDGVAGIVGRYESQGAYYECAIHPVMGVQLWRMHGGEDMELGGRKMAIDTTRFHRLTLSMRGSRITCTIDGEVAASVADPTLGAGRFGLTAGDDEAAQFARVVVRTS